MARNGILNNLDFFQLEIMILKFIWKNNCARIIKELLEKKKNEWADV